MQIEITNFISPKSVLTKNIHQNRTAVSFEGQNDTVEINGIQKNKTRKSKTLLGIGGAIAVTILAIGVYIFSRGKIKAKKIAEDARRLAEEAQQRAQRELELKKEQERLAEETRQKILQQLELKKEQERLAKEAQEEARLMAEKAKIEKIHKEKLQEFDIFKAPSLEDINVEDKTSLFHISCDQNILKPNALLKKLEEMRNHKFSKEEIKEILESMKFSDSQLQKIEEKIDIKLTNDIKKKIENIPLDSETSKEDAVKFVQNYCWNKNYIVKIKDKNAELTSLIKIIDETPMQVEETASAYLKRIISIHRQNNKLKYIEFQKAMNAKATPIINTTDEMCESACQYHKKFIESSSEYIANYIAGGDQIFKLSPEKQREVLEMLPKFALPTRDKGNCLSRYIYVSEGAMDDFLKQFEREGTIYEFNQITSCAKTLAGAEVRYRDNNPDMTVKLVIHPKGQHPMFEARDIGLGKYGADEVLYAPGAKFKYLGKIRHEVNPEMDNDFLNKNNEFVGKDPFAYESFRRWEIHLQEM